MTVELNLEFIRQAIDDGLKGRFTEKRNAVDAVRDEMERVAQEAFDRGWFNKKPEFTVRLSEGDPSGQRQVEIVALNGPASALLGMVSSGISRQP